MNIPISSTVSFIGFILLALGVFLVLAGFDIFSIEKITVQRGHKTWGIGAFFIVIGVIFLYPEFSSARRENTSSALSNASSPPTLTSPPLESPTETQAVSQATGTQQVLFSDKFEENKTGNWIVIDGNWKIEDGTYLQTDQTVTAAKSMAVASSSNCYTYSLRAKTIAGKEGFLIIFSLHDSYVWWSIGGWNNTLSIVEGIDNWNETYSEDIVVPGKWYEVKVIVNNNKATGLLDGAPIWTVDRSESQVPGLPDDGMRGTNLVGFVGLGTWNTSAAFDDVSVTESCE